MLKKDIIELCLLHMLSSEDLYGYEILRRLHESFPDTQESAIYALLRRLCKEGYTEQYEGKKSDGPTRKYYRITKSGYEKKDNLLNEWHRLRDTLSALGVQ
ncbi:MAG TPA: PadR family transcriptional regulator [Candidatus Butyricicoccus avistercoris]|uniref:PadR family transcriptional regulator n=1 Tax=Candidatus Butyricicoccus avistercoris TaxID=2838518 RepID=A0A9D1PGF3_9FIRM|nr:PadR family transcriptional regulator [Candidatus Butyricicoccus avistercoris]